MRIEVSKPTIEYLTNKYPQLTDNIIQYFLFCGQVKRKYIKQHKLNKYEFTYTPCHTLIISKALAEEYAVDNVLDLIPDEEGIIYKVHING